MPQQSHQFLRVRRRRNASTAMMLQMEGLLDGRKRNRDVTEQMEALADLSLTKSISNASSLQQEQGVAAKAEAVPRKRHLAVWRKLDEQDWETKKRSCRVIDAVLEDQEEDSNDTSRKRRRLMLLNTDADLNLTAEASKPKKNHPGYSILNPIERMVDDSLQQVAAGSLSAAQHLNFCCSDPNLAACALRWLTWCNAETGNLLHSCAMWNDVETANSLLSRTLKREQVEALTHAVDAEGRTPCEVAQLSGNVQICEVLEAFGGDQCKSLLSNDSFVYDMYYLDEACSHPSAPNSQDGIGNDNQAVTCELQGGVGYWDESGELVLEIPNDREDLLREIENGDYDEDSNSENWEGNDYPEDDCGENVCFDDDDDGDGDDDDEVDVSFRHHSVASNAPRSAFAFDDNDYAHDASYGIYGQETEYDDEC